MISQHPYAVAITVIAIILAAVLIYVLRREPKLSDVAREARASVSALRRILVPVRGFPHEERAVELACRLGQEQKGEIVLVTVIEVPLSLSLGAALPEQEERAAEALKRAEELVRAHDLEPVSRVERERDAGKGILKAARDLKADMVVIGLDPARSISVELIGPTTATLLRRANFEVILDRPAPPVVD